MIDTIIFDLDGVIIDTEHLWDGANRVFLERHGAVYDRALIKPLIAGKSLAEGARIMQEKCGFSGEPEVLASERRAIVEDQLRSGSRFIPGFLPFFDAVRTTHKTCVATSMDSRLLPIVDEQLGLAGMFSGNVFSIADVGHLSKPDPAIFLYAARQMGSQPSQCVVIEDAPKGIQAARNALMKCIGIATTFHESLLTEADVIVKKFEEIDLGAL